jgi:hypothetical protein
MRRLVLLPMRYLAVVLVALFVATSSPLAAQEAPVEPGARVRVKAPPLQPDWVRGTVVGWESGSLVLEPEKPEGDTPLTLARDQITQLDVHRGRKSAAGKGALIGLGSGAVAGFALGFAACAGNTGSPCTNDAGEGSPAGFALALGGVGAGLGALVGLLFRTDRWEAVPLEGIHVTFTPVYDGQPGLALSVSF